jgi:polypeptide N-acetylgalactosaminyltransferase
LRTIHSIYNRTPHELIHEIILVNDASTKQELYEPLEKYVKENFNGLVKIIVNKERKGLIVTRLVGAKIASGEVLLFLDCHIEVNINWLPPLLEPIALDPKTSTTPVVDDLQADTFEYRKVGFETRGVRN